MTVEEMKYSINKYKLEVDRIYVSLDNITDTLLETTRLFLENEIRENVEYVVIQRKPEITQTHEYGTLKQMKEEMYNLIQDVDSLMKTLFYSKKSFDYRGFKASIEDKVDVRDNIKNDIDRDYELCIRSVLGLAGRLLAKYQYIDAKCFRNRKGEKAEALIYMNEVVYTKRMSSIKDRLIDEFEDLYDYLYKIETYQRGIEQVVAKELWEQA